MLEDSLLCFLKRIAALGRVGPEYIISWDSHPRRHYSGERNRVFPRLALDPETLLRNDPVDYRKALHQLDPGTIRKQFRRPVRTRITCPNIRNPEGAACFIDRIDEPRSNDTRSGPECNEDYYQPSETFDRRPVPP